MHKVGLEWGAEARTSGVSNVSKEVFDIKIIMILLIKYHYVNLKEF